MLGTTINFIAEFKGLVSCFTWYSLKFFNFSVGFGFDHQDRVDYQSEVDGSPILLPPIISDHSLLPFILTNINNEETFEVAWQI